MTKDMTSGNPVKLIILFSIPLLIGNIFQQFYSMVDTLIVGRFIGVNALAAVGSTGSISFLIIGFILGLSSGFSVLVSQRFGANDVDGLKKAVTSSIFLCVIITIIVTVISMLCAKPLLILMNTPSDIIESAYSYIFIIFAGVAATVFYNMIASILRALGDSKTPLYFLIISSLINAALDLIFIIYFHMGVEGAAYATVISQGISGLLCLIYTSKKFDILKLQRKDWKFKSDILVKHLKIAIPMALQFSITALGIMILQSALNKFGSQVVAAYTAASKVEQLVTQPFVTFGVTMATYCAQNLGAGKIDRIYDGVKKCTIISIVTSIIASIIILLFGTNFTSIFLENANSEIIHYSQLYLNTCAASFVFLSLIFIYRNSLQGIGETFIPMMVGATELIARSLVAFTLPSLIGYFGICLATPFAWISGALPLFITFYIKIRKLKTSIKANIEAL